MSFVRDIAPRKLDTTTRKLERQGRCDEIMRKMRREQQCAEQAEHRRLQEVNKRNFIELTEKCFEGQDVLSGILEMHCESWKETRFVKTVPQMMMQLLSSVAETTTFAWYELKDWVKAVAEELGKPGMIEIWESGFNRVRAKVGKE